MNTQMKKILGGLSAGAAVLALSACLLPAGNGVGLDANGRDTTGTGIAPPPDTNLTLIVTQIFAPSGTVPGKCSGCHTGSVPSGSLNLSSVAAAQAALFTSPGVPKETFKAPTVHPVYRVKPGSPDSSYLYQKITGVFSSPAKAAGDARMPQGGPYLSAEKIALVRRWIELGAPIE